MAKRTSHRKADSSRVYKASDVHKRRVDRGARPGAALRSTSDVNAPEGPKRDASRTQFFKTSEAPPEQGVDDREVTGAIQGGAGEALSTTGKVTTGRIPSTTGKATTGRIPSATGETGTGRIASVGQQDDALLQKDLPQEAEAQGKPAKKKPTPRKRPSVSSKMQTVAGVPEEGAAEPGEGEEPEESEPLTPEEARSRAVKRIQEAASQLRRSKLRTALIAAAAVAVVVAIIAGLLYWTRCVRFDDHADMQGAWYVAGSVVPISIDEDEFHFTDDVSYAYTVDPVEKTIDVSLGLMEGRSYYRFSNDRQYLVIAKDDSEGAGSVSSQGLGRLVDDFCSLFGIDNFEMPSGDGVVVLERKPSPLSVIYEREANEVVAVKAAAEERMRQEEELAERKAEEEAAAAEQAAVEAQAEAERAALAQEEAAQAAAAEGQPV